MLPKEIACLQQDKIDDAFNTINSDIGYVRMNKCN